MFLKLPLISEIKFQAKTKNKRRLYLFLEKINSQEIPFFIFMKLSNTRLSYLHSFMKNKQSYLNAYVGLQATLFYVKIHQQNELFFHINFIQRLCRADLPIIQMSSYKRENSLSTEILIEMRFEMSVKYR